MRIEVVHRTDIGCVRDENEDALFVDPDCRVFVVADGMGGHNAGDVASQLASDLIAETLLASDLKKEKDIPDILRDTVEKAHQAIIDHAHKHPECEGMGTTVEVLWLRGRTAFWAHVGDSRIYLYRDSQLQQLTRDHSLINEHIEQGLLDPEQAHESPLRHVILQALGTEGKLEIDFGDLEIASGDLLLLCSDGLTDVIPNEEIEATLKRTDNLDTLADNAIEMARQRGGPDNISLILIQLS